MNQTTYKLESREVDHPEISNSDILIRIKFSAINHHELWALKEKELKSDSDIILGSDGAGEVVVVGAKVNNLRPGDAVVVNPSLNWGTNARVQGKGYEILGFPTQGTFAEFISFHEKYIYPKPGNLSFHEAASLPLAGVTAYRALFSRGEFEQKLLTLKK